GRELWEWLRGRLPAGSVRPSPCLGLCERAPAVLFQRAGEGAKDEAIAPATIQNLSPHPDPLPPPGGEGAQGSPSAPQTQDSRRDALRLLARVGRVDPESLDDYRAHGGYRALPRAFALGPGGVLPD